MGCIGVSRTKTKIVIKKVEVTDSSTKLASNFNQSTNKSNQNLTSKNKLDQMKSVGEDIKIQNIISKGKTTVQDDYNIITKVGKGSFGSVYKVEHKQTKALRALKVIKKDTLNYQDDDKEFLKEIEILIKIDHPNIIRIYEYFVDEINFYVITEFISGGELYDTISEWTSFDEGKAAYLMSQILSAVSYLHLNKIIHRDLKPENMLVENIKKNNSTFEEINIKLIDFGTCNYFEADKKLTLKVGSPYYIAPEVLKKSYNEKCDIWSCGVLLYLLLAGYPPFIGNSNEELFANIQKGDYDMTCDNWENVSKSAKNLVSLMLEKDPKKRISANDTFKHKWIVEYEKLTQSKVDIKQFQGVLKNIQNFNAREKFQQATIAYIVHFVIPIQEVEELKAVFKKLDKNGDGSLTYGELKEGFETVFGNLISEIQLNQIIKDIDGNSDGYISYEEFLRVAVNQNKILDNKNLKLAFDRFDLNKDGLLSADEIREVLGATNSEYSNALISLIDEDGNKAIDFDEFKKLMGSIVEKKENNNVHHKKNSNSKIKKIKSSESESKQEELKKVYKL